LGGSVTDIDGTFQYDQLTVEEKNLCISFPIQAYVIRQNMFKAFTMSDAIMGESGGLNDKKDAFRHAYFQAINTRDVPMRPPFSGATIVAFFAKAHESEVALALSLEKQMDMFNNDIGISHCVTCFPLITTDNDIADGIFYKLLNGDLRYLKPLDFNTRRTYDGNGDGVQDCGTCTNGIIPGVTIMIPTNQ
jgi:hypothetical protein